MKGKTLQVKLHTKLVLIMTALLALAVISTGVFAYRQASTGIINMVKQELIQSAGIYGEMVDRFIDQRRTDVEMIAQHPVIMDPHASLEEKTEILKTYHQTIGYYHTIAITDATGLQIADTGNIVGDNKSDLEWFQDAISGNTHISSIRMSRDLGVPIINYATPIYDLSGQITGTLVARLNLKESIWKIIDRYTELAIKEGRPSSYAYMIDANGLIIAHPDRKMILRDNLLDLGVPELAEAGRQMMNAETGVKNYTWHGVSKHIGFAPLTGYRDYRGQGWSIATGVDDHEFLAPVVAIRNGTIVIGVIVFAIGVLAAWLFSMRLTNPIRQMISEANKVSEGDLTSQIAVKSSDEIGQLAMAFNNMVEALKILVTRVNKSSTNLAAQSQQISASSQEVSSTMDHVAGSTSEVANLAEKSSSGSQTLSDSAKKMQQATNSGGKAVANTIQKIQAIRESVLETANNIKELEARSNKVSQITAVITSIADQTNLLALNAAIEAARAGEQGRGFAVVAEEVRKLAVQSAEAAKEISQIVNEIGQGMDAVSTSTETATTAIAEGVATASEAGELIKQIVSQINENVEMIQEIAHGSQQSSNATQNLAVSIEEVTSTMEQLTSSAQELASMADELAAMVGRFTV